MRMAQLDSLRGYNQDHYGTVQQEQCTEYVSEESACGYQVIREPQWNKGMLFRSGMLGDQKKYSNVGI